MPPAQALTRLARLGFAARGLVYVLTGWFAIDAAQTGSRPGDNQAALASLADQPLGRVLLAIMAAGLAGYAVWRLAEAALDPEHRGQSAKGAFARAGYAVSGVVHVVLAFYAARLALRSRVEGGASPGDSSAQDWTAWLMQQPGGLLLVALVGAALLAVAFTQARAAYTTDFTRHLGSDTPLPRYVTMIGRAGYTARAIVFALVGWFFLSAALSGDAREAGGMGQALRTVQQQDYGPALLWVVALGLLLFGVFSFVEARFRRIKTPK